jgi:hypothetical protein
MVARRRSARQSPRVTCGDAPRHGVVITHGQVPAARYDPVRSNASRMRMVFSYDFTIPASVGLPSPTAQSPTGRTPLPEWGAFLAAGGEVSWPSVGTFLAAYWENLMAADMSTTSREKARRGVGR